MSKMTLTRFMLSLLLLLGGSYKIYAAQPASNSSDGPTGTFQKMIVESGAVTLNVDLSRLNGMGSASSRPSPLNFAIAANSFFPVLVVNDVLRGAEQGSIALVQQSSAPVLPLPLGASMKQLVIEKLPSGANFDLAVRDSKTGFTFFNIEGHQYDYDAAAGSLSIQGGRVLISQEFAKALGRPADADVTIGNTSIGAAMQPIEVQTVVNGEIKSAVLPAVHSPSTGTQPGPDVIVGDLNGLQQFDNAVGTQVGLAVGTDSCNRGIVDLDWFALPQNDHPVIPQNLYRMSGGASNNERFEQIGQSSVKH